MMRFCLLMAAIAMIACGKPFSVEFADDNTATIRMSKAQEQTLWIPLDNRADNVRLTVVGSKEITVPLNARVAVEKVQYWMPLLLDSSIQEVVIEGVPAEAVAWQALKVGENPNKEEMYRQVAHYTPKIGWINDPNGMVYLDGEWHLFHQYNPMGSRWGNMSWGHAVSRDLVKWEYLPTALYPDEIGAIFSGSCVIDKDNTAGFGEGAMIAIYTSAGRKQTQSIAYSTDNGRTFTKYDKNPVLESEQVDFRDPKVFWHEPTERWIMPLACGNAMEFYSSPNLREWQFESRFGEDYGCHGGVWECPDLFEMPYKDGTKWVLFCSLTKNPEHGSSVQYFVGEFDGHTFVCDTPKEQTDFVGWGRDNYAIVTWSNAPDGRRVALGWQNNWQYGSEEEFPTTDFRSYMSLPCELKLIEHEGRAKLVSQPVKEFSSYLKEILTQQDIAITADYKVPATLAGNEALWIDCLLEDKSAQTMGVVLSNDKGEEVKIYFDNKAQAFKVDRTKSGEVDFHEMFAGEIEAPMSSAKQQKLTIVVDRASVECFTDISATSDLVFPTQGYNHITLYTVGGEATAKEIKVSQLEI